MKKEYIVTYEESGEMRVAKFKNYIKAKNFAKKKLALNNYPVSKIVTWLGMQMISEEMIYKYTA